MITLKPNQLIKKTTPKTLFITKDGDCFDDYVMIVKATAKKIEIATGDAGNGEAKIFSFESSMKTKRFLNLNFQDITVNDLPHLEKELHPIEFKNIKRIYGIEGAGFTTNLYINKKKVLVITDYADGSGILYDFYDGFDEQSELYRNTMDALKKTYGEPFYLGNKETTDEDLLLALFSYMSMQVFLNKSFSQYVDEKRMA